MQRRREESSAGQAASAITRSSGALTCGGPSCRGSCTRAPRSSNLHVPPPGPGGRTWGVEVGGERALHARAGNGEIKREPTGVEIEHDVKHVAFETDSLLLAARPASGGRVLHGLVAKSEEKAVPLPEDARQRLWRRAAASRRHCVERQRGLARRRPCDRVSKLQKASQRGYSFASVVASRCTAWCAVQ